MQVRFEVSARDGAREVYDAVYGALWSATMTDPKHPRRMDVDILTSVTGDKMYTLNVNEI